MLHRPNLKETLIAALGNPGAATSDFDLNNDVDAPEMELREAAVLMPLMVQNGNVRLILTKRSSALQHHPGQVAFPGGKQDPNDDNLMVTALREAEEEISLPRSSVEILGQLPAHQTVTGFRVTPFVGWIENPVNFKTEPGEVAEVFSVPVEHVLDTSNFSIEGRIWQRKMRKYYAVPYGAYYIWGATARMLRALAEQVIQ
jgi:8-oxo-dGTP pyrophosphatase MutT (NUDIX family)